MPQVESRERWRFADCSTVLSSDLDPSGFSAENGRRGAERMRTAGSARQHRVGESVFGGGCCCDLLLSESDVEQTAGKPYPIPLVKPGGIMPPSSAEQLGVPRPRQDLLVSICCTQKFQVSPEGSLAVGKELPPLLSSPRR
jgi:hypothetical protein